MDIMTMLDELEEVVDRGAKIPMTGKVLVDDEKIFDLIDKIRTALPEELRQAKWITKERERILEEAQTESGKLVDQGRSYISKLVEESEITRQAQSRAEELVGQAKRVSIEIRNGANAYAADLLGRVEKSLIEVVESVQQDREELVSSLKE